MPQRRALLSILSAGLLAMISVVVACQGEDPDPIDPCVGPFCTDGGAGEGSSTTDSASNAEAGCVGPCSGDVVWLRPIGSTAGDTVEQGIVDGAGNTYILVNAGGALGLGDNGGAPGVDAPAKFVAKLDPDGKPLWLKILGGGVSNAKTKLAVDLKGILFVAGEYIKAPADAAPTWGGVDTGLGNSGAFDIFILKVDPNGALVEKAQIGSSNTDFLQALGIDHDDRPVIFGKGLDAIVYDSATIPGGPFVLKLLSDLKVDWAHPIGLSKDSDATGVGIVPIGNKDLAVMGTCFGEVDYRGFGGNGIGSTTPPIPTDTFIMRLHEDGGMAPRNEDLLNIFGKRVDGSLTSPSSIAFRTSPTPGIAVVGQFHGLVGLGSATASLQVGDGGGLEPATYSALFNSNSLLAVDSRAIFDGNTAPYTAKLVAFDKDGNISLAGTMKDNADYGGGALASVGSHDGVVAHYGPSLKDHKWSKRFGGANLDNVVGMGVDPNGAVIVVGEFRAMADFPGGKTLTSKDGQTNVFVMKLAR